MPTHSESRSPSPKHPKHRSSHRRDRLRDYNKDDESPERTERSIPPSVEPISEDDYFLKSAEFSRWLRVEKGKVGSIPMKYCFNFLMKYDSTSTNSKRIKLAGVHSG